jgi:hypothetical protein
MNALPTWNHRCPAYRLFEEHCCFYSGSTSTPSTAWAMHMKSRSERWISWTWCLAKWGFRPLCIFSFITSVGGEFGEQRPLFAYQIQSPLVLYPNLEAGLDHFFRSIHQNCQNRRCGGRNNVTCVIVAAVRGLTMIVNLCEMKNSHGTSTIRVTMSSDTRVWLWQMGRHQGLY